MDPKRVIAGIAFLAAATVGPSLAQQPKAVRGTIEKIDGATVSIKPASGPAVQVKLLDNVKVFDVKAATLADIQKGDFIGVGAVPQPDGTQKAVQITIFAESLRGIGEGFRPWDRPGTTMTNGTVDSTVESVNGPVLKVKYKGGEQTIVVGPDTKIRRYVEGGRDDLKPGAHVAVTRPETGPDGGLQTARINVGVGDIVP